MKLSEREAVCVFCLPSSPSTPLCTTPTFLAFFKTVGFHDPLSLNQACFHSKAAFMSFVLYKCTI